MCAVSFVGDTYKRHFEEPLYRQYPWFPASDQTVPAPSVSKQEFDQLKAKVEEMIALLKAAKEFDILTKQADCHMDEKMAFLRKVAKLVGVDLDKATGLAPKAT